MPAPRTARLAAVSAACILVVLAVHGPALAGYFQADDFLWLRHRDWPSTQAAFTGSWGLGIAFRPISRLSLYLDGCLFGWSAWGWHATDLALHAAAGVLLAYTCRAARLAWPESLLAALLFLAFPMQWETVDWISGRTGSLCAVFMLVATLAWLTGGRPWAAWLVSGQALALLSYEPACVMPLAMALLAPSLVRSGRIPASRAWQGIATAAACVGATWTLRAVALGSAGIAIDVVPETAMPGALHDMLALGAHLWRDFTGPGFVAAAALLSVGLPSPATRAPVASLLATAAVLYAPFLRADGFTERFAYLASLPAAAALVLAARALPGRATVPVLMALALWCGVLAQGRAEGMRDAGQEVRALLDQVAHLPQDGTPAVFEGLPTHQGVYYLFWANFEDAVALRRPIVARAAAPPRHYRFDPRSQRFEATSY